MLRSYKPIIEPYNEDIESSLMKLKRKLKGTSSVQTDDMKKIRLRIEESNTEEVLMANNHNHVTKRQDIEGLCCSYF